MARSVVWTVQLKLRLRSIASFPSCFGHRRRVAYSAALADECDVETAALKAIANGVEVTIHAPEGGTADFPARISWRARQPAPLKVPVYIAIAIRAMCAFAWRRSHPNLPAPDNDLAMANRLPELPGFLALTPQTRGPLGLEFGKGKTRALVPLHQPDARLAGEFEIEGLAAGPLSIEAAVVAPGPLAANAMFPPGSTAPSRSHPVRRGSSCRTPMTSISPVGSSSRTTVAISRTSSTGAIASTTSRPKQNSSTAPARTSTFRQQRASWWQMQAAQVSRVTDKLRSHRPCHRRGHRDACRVRHRLARGRCLSAGCTGLVRQSFHTAYVDQPPTYPSGRSRRGSCDSFLTFSHPGSCHACASWSDGNFLLDLDDGVLAFTGREGFAAATSFFELASGQLVCCGENDAQLAATIARYDVLPISLGRGFQARTPIRFSHIYDALADPNAKELAEQPSFKDAIALEDKVCSRPTACSIPGASESRLPHWVHPRWSAAIGARAWCRTLPDKPR